MNSSDISNSGKSAQIITSNSGNVVHESTLEGHGSSSCRKHNLKPYIVFLIVQMR
ncbi:unnamed protein product [Rhodiola kirilowii]